MSYVYIIGSEKGAVKVGFSTDPERRKFELVAEGFGETWVREAHPKPRKEARLVERVAHFLLRKKRLRGEWYDVSLNEAMEAVRAAISIVEKNDPRLLEECRETRPDTKTAYIGVRLEPRDKERLDLIAAWEDRDPAVLARKALLDLMRGYVDNNELGKLIERREQGASAEALEAKRPRP